MTKKLPPPTLDELHQAHNDLALAVMLLRQQVEQFAVEVVELKERLQALLDEDVDNMEQD